MTRGFLLAAILYSCFSVAVRAEEKKADTTKPVAAEAAKAADGEKKPDGSLHEQDIYIPYDKLQGVFEKHGRGVYLPYEKFEELWKAAEEKNRPAAAPRPPAGFVVNEIESEAVVGKDVVQVTAHLQIELLSEGWHEVPLRLADAAIGKATIKGEAARILGGAGDEHRLLIEHKGKQSERIELVLEYARAITRSPGQNSVCFQAPQAAVNRWKVRIPQAGVKVSLNPLIAATEVPAEKANTPRTAPSSDETVVLAFVGAAPEVQIDWTPKAEGATGLTALASVQAEQAIWVHEGITRVRTNLVYSISRAELKELALEVPAEYKIVNVFDPNVRQWSVDPPAGGLQKITAQLFEPAKTTQAVVVELEKIADQKRQQTLKAPVVKALNVGRQQGFVVAEVSSGLRAEAAKTTGLLQIDAAELPPALRGTPWAFAYRYGAVPYELELGLEEVQPRITVESLVEATLEPEKLRIDLTAFYNIERAGVFKLDLDVPEGFEVRSVTGAGGSFAVSPGSPPVAYTPADVESHHLEGDKKNHLAVNLSRKALGCVGLKVRLQRDLHEPNLIAPTGKQSEIDLPVPQPSKSSVERSAGRLIVAAPESLRVNPAKADGLRPVSYQEAMQGISCEQSGGAGAAPVLSFVFTQEPIALQLSAERKRPQITMRQMLVARLDEGVVKYQATFHYGILYSGVKSLRIDVPADVAPLLRNNTPGIHEKTIDPPPADLDKNMVAWSFSGEGELLGEGDINLTWEKKLDKLDVGKKPVHVVVPRLVPRGADLAWGQIVLAKAETLDFEEGDDVKGLRPIDPQRDLSTPVAGAARAFEFHDEWSLPLSVTRYELEDVKRTSIDRAVCRMVITPAGEIAAQALYRVRSVRPRLSVQLPTKATADSDPVRINGQPIMLQKGPNDALVVPLVNASAEEPFVLEIRYVLPAGQPLALPTFVEDAAVQKVYLCAFVPPDHEVVRTSGSWSEDFQWAQSEDGRWVPRSAQSHDERVAWVCEGNRAAGDAARTFHFDGTPLIFSTLRPDPKNTVELWTISRLVLSGWVFCLATLLGLALLWRSWTMRIAVVAFLIAALAVLGVFWPTLTLHILGPLGLAVDVVALAWIVAALIGFIRHFGAMRSAFGTTWSAWVASRQPLPAAAPSPASTPVEEKGEPKHE